jgi:WD40 repeat protein/tetratricopeptide (TPR) repeat protein
MWDTATGAEVMTLSEHDSMVSAIAFSPDGERIVSGSADKTIKVWDATNGTELMTLRGHEDAVSSAGFSPDSKLIVSGSKDGTIRLWDAVTGDERRTLRGHKDGGPVSFSPDGERIISKSSDTIKMWDVATGAELTTLRGRKGAVTFVLFTPDGKRLVSGNGDKTMTVWDVATGTELMTLHGGPVNVTTGIELLMARRGGPANAVAFSPDGKRLVFGGRGGAVKICDSATGAELMTLQVQQKFPLTSVAFSPDGKTIAAGSVVGVIKLWKSCAPPGGYEPQWTAKGAMKVVGQLYEKHGSYQEVIDRLKADKTLDEPVRVVALRIANARLWEDAKKLAQEAVDQISQHIEQGRYEEAQALLVKVLEGMGPDVQKHALALGSIDNLASLYKDRGHYEEAEQLLAKVLDMSLLVLGDKHSATLDSLERLASLCISRRHYEKAEHIYVKAVELYPDTAYNWSRIALLQLYAGDTEDYRKTCAWMLNHFVRREGLDNAFGPTWTCFACSLAPNAVEDFASAIKLAERGVARSDNFVYDRFNLGAILYRAGRFEEAIEELDKLVVSWEKTGRVPVQISPAYPWFFVAMAHHQLDQHEEAEKWLVKANRRVEQEIAGNPIAWGRPLVLELLQAEAQRLLGVSEQ